MSLRPDEMLIEDTLSPQQIDSLYLYNPDGQGIRSRGAVERDYSEQPLETFAPPSEITIIPRSEWSARIKEQEREKSRLSDIRRRAMSGSPFPSLDQGQVGYCWKHSVVHTAMISRAVANAPYVALSAYAGAAIIKKGRDEGGWCGLAAEFARKHGIATQKSWPQGSRNLALDTPALRAEMALYKITEDWVDLTRQVWDQNLTFDMIASCLLSGIPVALDFAWWGHSVCGLDLVEVEPGSFGIRILNSWSDRWGDLGESVLRGNKAIPMGAVATRSVGRLAA